MQEMEKELLASQISTLSSSVNDLKIQLITSYHEGNQELKGMFHNLDNRVKNLEDMVKGTGDHRQSIESRQSHNEEEIRKIKEILNRDEVWKKWATAIISSILAATITTLVGYNILNFLDEKQEKKEKQEQKEKEQQEK